MRYFLQFIFLLFSLVFSNKLSAQKLKSFTPDSIEYIMELKQFLVEARGKEGEGLWEWFSQEFYSGKYSEELKTFIYQTSNDMLQKKHSPMPDFENFFYCVDYLADDKELYSKNFKSWKRCTEKLTEKSVNFRKYSDFLKFSFTLFKSNLISEKSVVVYRASSKNYNIQFDEEKKLPKIVFGKTNITCLAYNDSTVIYDTEGVYYPTESEFYGAGGKGNWERSGLKKDTVYVLFNKYKLLTNTSQFKADSVTFFNLKYFKVGLLGYYEEKIIPNVETEKVSYPRFESYERRLEIKNILPDIDYDGSFRYNGANFIGKGTKEQPAFLKFYRNDTLFLKASSETFIIKENRLSSENAKISIYVRKDSIYHPGLNFDFFRNTDLVNLYRNNKGIQKSPFYNSYHKIEMYTEFISWKRKDPIMNFGSFNATLSNNNNYISENNIKNSESAFLSNDFFVEEDYNQLQGNGNVNPLLYFYDAQKHFKSKEYGLVEAAKFLKMFADDLENTAMVLSYKGFLDYDYQNKTIKNKTKLMHYINSKNGWKDYDMISIASTVKSSEQNATLSLLNFDLKIRGIKAVIISDSQSVYLRPYGGEVTMKENRFLKFGGIVNAGLAEYHGKDLEFDWKNFKVNLNQVDSLAFYTASEELNEKGQYEYKKVKSVLQDVKGELFIDSPGNKSGRKSDGKYPYMTSDKESYVYYDKPFIAKGVYKQDKFYFKVDKFELDSLDNLYKKDLNFAGLFASAGIFPDFRENLTLMKDNSLGFVRNTPPEGMPLYGGKSNYEAEISLSNQGLKGNGTLTYLNSTAKSDEFQFYPDSTNAFTTKYDIAEQGPPQDEYPRVEANKTYIHYMPYKDLMEIKKVDEPIQMFNGQAQMLSTLYMRPKQLLGKGLMTILNSELEANLLRYKQNEIFSDTASFRQASIQKSDDNVFGVESSNLNAHIDFNNRLGNFKSNDGTSLIKLNTIKYICFMDEFTWYMDNEDIAFKSNNNEVVEADPSNSGLDLKGSRFISINAEQDSLQWLAASARYNNRNAILFAEQVSFIKVADAAIYPDSGKVTIEKNAYMRPLKNSRILANTITKFHTLTNCSLQVLGRFKYQGNGYKDYIDENKALQTIFFDELGVDQTKQTTGKGLIAEESNFTLSPQYKYRGKTSLKASEEALTFDGYVFLTHSCEKLSKTWIRFNAAIDPNSIYIPISDKAENHLEKSIFAGSLVTNDSTHIYSSFLSMKKTYSDNLISSANGFLFYDKTSKEFKVSSKEKLEIFNLPGNYVSLNNETCKIYGEGKLDFGTDLGQIKTKPVGYVRQEVSDNNVLMELMLGIDFFFSGSALNEMTDDFKKQFKTGGAEPVNFDAEVFNKGLMEFVGKEEGSKLIGELNVRGNYRRFPEELNFKLFFDHIRLKWDEVSASYRSFGKIGLGSIEKEEFHKLIDAKIQIKKKRVNSEIDIYIEVSEGKYYYFNYKNGIMMVYSSNEKFNQTIAETKNDKRKMEVAKGQKGFRYDLANERKVKDFKRRFDAAEADVEESEDDKKKRKKDKEE